MRIIYFLFLILSIAGCRPQTKRKYYEDGSLKSEAEIKNGKYIGDFTIYFPNGKLKAKGIWEDGVGNGHIERYYENGKIEEKSSWSNNLQDGVTEIYHETGEIKFRGLYKKGLKIGEHLISKKSGEIAERMLYDEESNLYYLVKFESAGKKEMELMFPVFEFEKDADSVRIFIQTRIKYNGIGTFLLGTKQSGEEFKAISKGIEIKSDSIKSIKIHQSGLSDSYFRFDFIPAESDSLPSFGYDKRLFMKKEAPKEFVEFV